MLREFHARHLGPDEDVIVTFQGCLDEAMDERPVQAFLESHPADTCPASHGSARCALPRHRLGAEFIPDFVIGEHHSDGYGWALLELESPRLSFFAKSGDPRVQLTHAIRQVQDRRAWLHRNQDYARRLRNEAGLGLTDTTAGVPGIVPMGRRAVVDLQTNARRRQMASNFIHMITSSRRPGPAYSDEKHTEPCGPAVRRSSNRTVVARP